MEVYPAPSHHPTTPISCKAQAECPQCKEGQQLDQSHGCYFVSSSYHERWQLLCHFNASVHTVWQILKTPTMLDNVKEYINTRLLQAGFSTDDIANVNTRYGIISVAHKDQTVFWLFEQLWNNRPDQIPNFQPAWVDPPAPSTSPSPSSSQGPADSSGQEVKQKTDSEDGTPLCTRKSPS